MKIIMGHLTNKSFLIYSLTYLTMLKTNYKTICLRIITFNRPCLLQMLVITNLSKTNYQDNPLLLLILVTTNLSKTNYQQNPLLLLISNLSKTNYHQNNPLLLLICKAMENVKTANSVKPELLQISAVLSVLELMVNNMVGNANVLRSAKVKTNMVKVSG